jgi:hypothetical protein
MEPVKTLRLLPAVLVAFLLPAAPVPAAPAPAPPPDGSTLQEPPEFAVARPAVEKGLAWLAKQQVRDGSRSHGAWKCNVGFKINEDYRITETNAAHPGVTALAGTAFLAGGHLPGRGKYGEQVRDAVRYVASCVDDKGFIRDNGTRMYSHAFAALFLAEAYGSTLGREDNAVVREALDRAVQFILRAQNQQGGWRYEANAVDSDMSITVCQVMALRAARNKGIHVPQEAVDRAIRYVLDSAETGGRSFGGFYGNDMRRGAFKYQYREKQPINTRASLALTAAAMTTLFGAALYDDGAIVSWVRDHEMTRYTRLGQKPPTIAEMAQYILDEYPSHTREYGDHYFFYYGHYYASQAMFTAGGKWWERYYPPVRDHLLRQQDEDGSWNVRQVGRTFGTAVACFVLQVPCRYLPVVDQR